DTRALHSFPTRRSSDLEGDIGGERVFQFPQPLCAVRGAGRLDLSKLLRREPLLLKFELAGFDEFRSQCYDAAELPPAQACDLLRSEEHTSELQSPYDLV